ncbi:MAG: TonB-dependent receptor [Armatimonadota bacterium]
MNYRSFTLYVLAVVLAALPAWCQEEPTDEEITVTVTARQWEEPLQEVPGSVSVISGQTLETAGVQDVQGAAHLVPNITLPDFSVRWLNFPFIRGIGSGRTTPAVTTIIDGVPQLSYLTTNQVLAGVERVEFLRGPQGSLYGRNTLAGVINVVPELPSEEPTAFARMGAGSEDLRDLRLGASGPLGKGMLGSLHLGVAARDGFTTNTITGNRLDDRQATFGRAQVLWPDAGPWSVRVSVTGERDRDGDYALGDLASLRANPRVVSRDFEGFNRRELIQPVLTAIRQGQSTQLTLITALQQAEVHDRTDVDFSPLDLFRRGTDETFRAWTQEVRLGSREDGKLRWLLGALLFTAKNESDNTTFFSAGAAAGMGVPFPFAQHSTADIESRGASPYGQVSLALSPRLDLTLGLRHDYERREAELLDFTDPALSAPNAVSEERDFNQTSPRASVSYRLAENALWYVNAAQGYKTGGFNAAAPPGGTVYDEEISRTYETGVKGNWRGVTANLCLFRTEWDDIQLDVPLGLPGVFFIDNAGEATSQGLELELTGRPIRGLQLFGGIGLLDTEFGAGSQSGGTDVSGNNLPFAPQVTGRVSALLTRPLRGDWRGFARADVLYTGEYDYDALNAEQQEAYTLVNLRVGADNGPWRVEGWVSNLFNQEYIPVALPVSIAPSGYVGESGAPRTVGVSVGYRFP